MLEEFISNARLLVNTLGYKIFDSIVESTVKHQDGQMYFYIHGARGANAKGVLVADGFAVMKDSVIANTTVPSMSSSLVQLRNTLLEKGIIDESCHLTKDHIFTSPSLAAAIVMGRNANGRTEWKTQDGKSIRDLEENEVASANSSVQN